jgi:GntR family transcriptional regulator
MISDDNYMDIHIDKKSRIPINDQIKEQITGLVHSMRIKAGDQLPTIRVLAEALAVNVNTVALAYRDLSREHVIITERGRGTFIASTPGDADMHQLRRERLQQLMTALVKETDRLGYSREEVEQGFNELFRK